MKILQMRAFLIRMLCLFTVIQYGAKAQDSAAQVLGDYVTIYFNGISPEEDSPHYGPDVPSQPLAPWSKKTGTFGIANPERGFQVRAGYFDVYAEGVNNFYENVKGDNALKIEPLGEYMRKFCDDGITLVELEQYVHFDEDQLKNKASVPISQLDDAAKLFTVDLNRLGLKANFIMNSDFKFLPGAYYNPLIPDYADVSPGGQRVLGLKHFISEMQPLYDSISPYVAVANLGWISAPYDVNTYRLSGKWNRENFGKWDNYPWYDEKLSGTIFPNYHGKFVESTQRFDWNVAHSYSHPHIANMSDFSELRKMVINEIFDAFPYQKLLTNSLNPWGTYMMTQATNWNGTGYDPRKLIHKHFLGPYHSTGGDWWSGNTSLKQLYSEKDYFLRIGYYDGAFGGDTYSHAWTIANAETAEIHWLKGYKDTLPHLGGDYDDQAIYTDSYKLRSYRHNMWQHGDLPIYETGDPADNRQFYDPHLAEKISTFAAHYNRRNEWYKDNNPGGYNEVYDYQIGEGISSGELQDGFFSALKMRYFNFTSLGIMHNYLLDGRSPYEMPHGYEGGTEIGEDTYEGDGIPKRYNTAIMDWKNEDFISLQQVQAFGMPVSDKYFDNETQTRSAYQYIRDHLGYRLELQKAKLRSSTFGIKVDVDIINRGFAAPQNARTIYFSILNSENEIVHEVVAQKKSSDEEWRTWQPDKFAVAHLGSNGSNYFYDSYWQNADSAWADQGKDLDNMIIGGIPLGEFESEWHHFPLDIEYEPYTYHVVSATIPSQYNTNQYRVGIRLPDPDPGLKENPKYSVKFANMATYIPCNGVTVLMTLGTDHSATSLVDSDGDGIPNNQEEGSDIYNPKNLDVSNVEVDCLNCDHLNRRQIILGDEPKKSDDGDVIISPH